MPGKRARPSRVIRIARHEKHKEMKQQQKKAKRQNISRFKEHLLGVKTPKDHPLNRMPADDAADSQVQPVLDFRGLLQQRARARQARFDRWRSGRKSRGTIRLYGYAADPHAVQAKLAIKTSRQAFTFQEPQLPYWMVPDEDDMEHDEEPSGDGDKNDTQGDTTDGEKKATPAILLEPLKMIHGDIVLTSPWEICLYVDTLLQAGSKVIKNRHTTANRGAAPYFPSAPNDRQRCMCVLRTLHTSLVLPFWTLVEKTLDQTTEALSLITKAAADVEELLQASSSKYAFDLKRPGVLEKWATPLFQRLQVLGLWTPSESLATWINHCLTNEMEESEHTDASLQEFHTSGTGKERPVWVNEVTADSVWQ